MNFVVIQNFPFATQGHGNTKWLHQKVSTTSPGRNIAIFWHTSYTCHVWPPLISRSYLLQAPNLPSTGGAPPTGATHQLSKFFQQSHVDMTWVNGRVPNGRGWIFKDEGWSCWLFTLFNPQLFRCFVWRDVPIQNSSRKVPVDDGGWCWKLRRNFPLSLVSILWWWILRIGWCPQSSTTKFTIGSSDYTQKNERTSAKTPSWLPNSLPFLTIGSKKCLEADRVVSRQWRVEREANSFFYFPVLKCLLKS